jgi:hypothetical protein
VQEVQKLFTQVSEALTKQEPDENLLETLKKIKESNSTVYQVVNSYQEQVAKAIAHLEKLGATKQQEVEKD